MKDFGVGKLRLAEKISINAKNFLKEIEKVEGKPSAIDQCLNVAIVNVIFNIIAGDV